MSEMHTQLKAAAIEGDMIVLEQIQKGELLLDDSDFLFAENDWGYNFVQYAAEQKKDNFICKVFNVIKNQDILLQLLLHQSKGGANSLHSTAFYGCPNATKVLVDFYLSWCKNQEKVAIAQHPWKVVNIYGRTPLHDALEDCNDDLAHYLLSLDRSYIYDKLDNQRQSPLFLAVKNRCTKVIEEILCPEHHLPVTDTSFIGREGKTALHQAIISMCGERVVRGLLTKLKEKPDLIWKKDSEGRTALHYAASKGDKEQVEWLLRDELLTSILLMCDQNSESPLILAWKLGHHSTVETILKHCPSMLQWIGRSNTTLLHHIKLKSREEYNELLEIPETKYILNITDNNGMTPLHQAICDGNYLLADLLFEKEGVNDAIQNKEGKTPVQLLAERSHHSTEFADLAQKYLPKRQYFPFTADMKEVRNTLMVVAALLATITFQAAFTIPDATLKRRPLFAIFLIADTFAMCCSLVVLFWLIWAMVEYDNKKSQILLNRTFSVLRLSFYGVLVAFVVVAFAIALDKSLTLAIIATIICFFVPLLSSRTIVSKFFKCGRTKTLTITAIRLSLWRQD